MFRGKQQKLLVPLVCELGAVGLYLQTIPKPHCYFQWRLQLIFISTNCKLYTLLSFGYECLWIAQAYKWHKHACVNIASRLPDYFMFH